ncbi:MAG: hypothetical protein KDA24_06165 [Deltaproteobacteria bacterium]|nr:hypothetical protein [Deltaproteobacteria bacterium]
MTDREKRLDLLLGELPAEHPVPAGLDASVLAAARAPAPETRTASRRWGWLVAALLMAGLLGAETQELLSPPPTVLLAGGSQLVTGHTRVLAGSRVVEVDGRAVISVEPAVDLLREEGQEAEHMKTTHLVAALAGSLVTVAVYEGQARIVGAEDAPAVLVQPGETRTVGTPKPGPRPRVVRKMVRAPQGDGLAVEEADSDAVIEALEDEIASLRRQQAISAGQLAEVAGEPQPWPEDVPDAFLPANFERSIRSLVAEEGAGDLLVVDCAEFPCLTVLRPGPYDGEGAPPQVMAVVDGMKGLLGDTGVSVHVSKTGDGDSDLLLTGLSFAPEGRANPDVQTRAAYRMEGHLRGLTDELVDEPDSQDEDVEFE